jgi:hypothetical protein
VEEKFPPTNTKEVQLHKPRMPPPDYTADGNHDCDTRVSRENTARSNHSTEQGSKGVPESLQPGAFQENGHGPDSPRNGRRDTMRMASRPIRLDRQLEVEAARDQARKAIMDNLKAQEDGGGEVEGELTEKEKSKKRMVDGVALFKSVEQYEQEMYDTLDEKAYDVEELYFDDKRIVVQIATSDWFNNFTLLVIVFNVCWIGYDTDANTEANILDAPMAFLVMEYFFTVFYTIEIVVRFLSFRETMAAFKDNLFLFDFVLVMFMLLENVVFAFIFSSANVNLGVFNVLKLLRLVRLFRLARIVRSVPELMTLLRSMKEAARSVAAVSVLLWGNIYIFAIVFRLIWINGTHGEPGLFDNVTESMFTLIAGALSAEYPDGMDHYGMKVLYLMHLLITNTLILHILVGLMCAIVTTAGTAQRDRVAISNARDTLRSYYDAADTNENGKLDIFEFFELLSQPPVFASLQRMSIDVIHWLNTAESTFRDIEEISFAQFLSAALNLRAKNTARVSDVVTVQKLLTAEMIDLEAHLGSIEKTVTANRKQQEEASREVVKRLNSLESAVLSRLDKLIQVPTRPDAPSAVCPDRQG